LTHETLFISVAGTSVDGKLDVYRVTTSSEGIPAIASVTGRIIAQLRPPFAEHVLALAGQHLSRIGTDYFGVPQRPRDD
jgi:hypothetical protein